MRHLVGYLLFAYVLSHAVDSPIRWALGGVGLEAVIYLRDAALVLAIVVGTVTAIIERRSFTGLLMLGMAGATMLFTAKAWGLPIGQALFGFKVWLPLAVGFVLAATGQLRQLHRPRLWFAIWLIACVGVGLNYFVRYPWTGMSVSVGDFDIAANREWTTFGVRRLSGFARSSYDAAMLILAIFIYLAIMCRSVVTKLFVIVVTGGAVAMTTSKGALGTYVVICGLMGIVWMSSAASRAGPWLATFIVTSGAAGLIAPFWAFNAEMPRFATGSLQQKLLESFVSRGWETWPLAFDLLSGWQWVVGRGFGGIGAAQRLFEAELANPADNFFVYLYVSAGLLGLVLYLVLVVGAITLRSASRHGQWVLLMLAAIFLYGITANVVENAVFGLMAGVCLAAITRAGRVPAADDLPVVPVLANVQAPGPRALRVGPLSHPS